jgi:uncharacterized protein (DUF302 family)
MGRITTPLRLTLPTAGRANFCISNCGDLRSFQPFQTTGVPSPSSGTASFDALKSAVEKDLSTAGLVLLCSSGKARLRVKRFEMTRKIEIERFSLTTSKQFDEVIAGVNAGIGHPDMAEFGRSTREARSFAELKSAVEKGLSTVGLMLFMQLDHGAILRKETGRDTPKMIRFVIGNPLIMKEMVKHVPDAGSYAPVTVLVDERADGVHLSYDRMASFLAPYGNRDALEVARNLDKKIEDLLRQAAA